MAHDGHAGASSSEARSSQPETRVSKEQRGATSDDTHSRIGTFLTKRTPSVSAAAKQPATSRRSLQSESDLRIGSSVDTKSPSLRDSRIPSQTRQTVAGSRDIRKSEGGDVRSGQSQKRIESFGSPREQKQTDVRVTDGSRPAAGPDRSRLKKVVPETQTTITGGGATLNRIQRTDGTRIHRYATVSPSYVTYYDQPGLVSHAYHYDYAYRDYHGLLCTRLVWPRYYVPVYYSYGPGFTFRYVYPYYHRKYIFVSLGGYWPFDYYYTRYYWYGCHPYYWYGYYPIAREVQGDTYNYYTYNYHNGEQAVGYQSQVADPALFENLAEQQAPPAETTLADVYFEEAVKAFEVGEYGTAVQKFTKAMELAPEDMILPFARSQALMAGGQYSQAAAVLREALAKVQPEKEGVFYPRGLYPDEDTLLEQIDLLAKQAESYNFDADLQLLLGYQLLGIGQTDRAVEPLMHAGRDLVNADASAVLLKLVEKIKTPSSEAEPKDKPKNGEPAPAPAPSGQSPAAPAHSHPASQAIIGGRSTRLTETMFLTSLGALATGVGIRRFTHC
jgi:hypothetical protein